MAQEQPEGAAAPAPSGPPRPRTLAEKVDYLFATVHPKKGEYSYEHVATSIKEAGGPTISAAYIWMLRKGQRDNPTMKHLEALSGFFGVPPAYFFDDKTADRVAEQLDLVVAIRDSGIRSIAMRANGLSQGSIRTIRDMVEQVRRLEGLPDPEPVSETERPEGTPPERT